MDQCEEPRCNEHATKNWHGRKVCPDHFDMYREQQDRELADLNRMY